MENVLGKLADFPRLHLYGCDFGCNCLCTRTHLWNLCRVFFYDFGHSASGGREESGKISGCDTYVRIGGCCCRTKNGQSAFFVRSGNCVPGALASTVYLLPEVFGEGKDVK